LKCFTLNSSNNGGNSEMISEWKPRTGDENFTEVFGYNVTVGLAILLFFA
jgi:hypothetical protein